MNPDPSPPKDIAQKLFDAVRPFAEKYMADIMSSDVSKLNS